LNATLDLQAVRDIAAETGIPPSFIEKDWHAVQLLTLLSSFKNSKGVSLVFTGGTSLSKGYGLIQRFSEDLDFILISAAPTTESQRRALRQEILAHVVADGRFQVDDAKLLRGDNNRFFKAPILYPVAFPDNALRPYLQLEMTFTESDAPINPCPIHSIVSNIAGVAPETSIFCISPLKTAADKLSALTWRVLVRDRTAPTDDPTIIRHLHDLAALEPLIENAADDFIQLARHSLLQDRTRRGGEAITTLSDSERLTRALKLIREDSLYSEEYARFVTAMSYADDADRIDFITAYAAFSRIVNLYLTNL
jgi:predicted nucleotidyltransferase component of viral defense system